MFSSRVTPDSYHSTLSLHDNMIVCFHLSGNKTFRPTLRASYIHTEISDISTGLLHPHRNFGFLHGSLTPTQRFRITPRVSYTHTKILDNSTGLLHPHKNFRFLHGSFTTTQKFRITPRVSYTQGDIPNFCVGVRDPWRNPKFLPLIPPAPPEGRVLKTKGQKLKSVAAHLTTDMKGLLLLDPL